MGKRKSKANPTANKRRVKLETVFCCPFCNHATSVKCHIDVKLWIGEARCMICDESFAMKATNLTTPIDIYSEWIDECERVNIIEDNEVF